MEYLVNEEPLFVCACEPSGDVYAALLVKRLKAMNPDITIFGVGGEHMHSVGVKILMTYDRLMTFGIPSGVLSSYTNYRVYKEICRALYSIGPKIFIPVAYPGMNLLLSRYAKFLGCHVYYYLPPQIWAWAEFRKYFIKKWVDRVVTVLPFEYKYYIKRGIATDYFKNPLGDELIKIQRTDFSKRIGLMPGSRTKEIQKNLPIIRELINEVYRKRYDVECNLIIHSKQALENNEWLFEKLVSLTYLNQHKFSIITENRYQIMKNCDLLVTSSGTASLEAAMMMIPQVFFYHTSLFEHYVVKRFLKITEYSLANLYYNKPVVPCFVLNSKSEIVQHVMRIISLHYD